MLNRIKDNQKLDVVSNMLDAFPNAQNVFVGLTSPARKAAFAAQLVDSIRRIEYLRQTSMRARSVRLFTPYSGSFAPFGGAAALQKSGRNDDAYWLVFLATHFSKHKADGWNLTEDFYGRFGQGGVWDWSAATQDPQAIAVWLEGIYPQVTSAGRSRRFGNHRKFETLKPGPKGTGHAIATYIEWIIGYGSHQALINHAHGCVGQNPKDVFAYLYKDLDNVAKFGRLGKFDLLCNLSNLLIAPILPDIAYIAGSSGPLAGAKLLFGNRKAVKKLETICAELAEHLDVSPQVIEDALCNWQKKPDKYVYFRG
jgi:hypothetical protein